MYRKVLKKFYDSGGQIIAGLKRHCHCDTIRDSQYKAVHGAAWREFFASFSVASHFFGHLSPECSRQLQETPKFFEPGNYVAVPLVNIERGICLNLQGQPDLSRRTLITGRTCQLDEPFKT